MCTKYDKSEWFNFYFNKPLQLITSHAYSHLIFFLKKSLN